MITFGLVMRADAKATRIFSPPEIFRGDREIRSVICICSAVRSSSLSMISPVIRLNMSGDAISSLTREKSMFLSGNSETHPIVHTLGLIPPMRIEPCSGRVIPDISSSRLLFPAPFGPIIAVIPGSMHKRGIFRHLNRRSRISIIYCA